MKFTAAITRRCNLACPYCYVSCDGREMSTEMANQAVDMAVALLPPGDILDFGFFGGEPLLRLDLIRHMTRRLREHQETNGFNLALGLTTNGVFLVDPVLEFMAEEEIVPCISLDGPREVFDRQRGSSSGESCFDRVVSNLDKAARVLPSMKINAVYGPDSLALLPETVEFLCGFGVPVELNLDITTPWKEESLEQSDQVFAEIGEFYLKRFMMGSPVQLQPLADHLLMGIVGGMDPECRCTLGVGEIAVDVDGRIYPCERLIGQQELVIGDIRQGIDPSKQARVVEDHRTPHETCLDCSLIKYCNHSCGCTNWFLTGNYGTADRAVCKIEKSLFKVARDLLEPLSATREFTGHFMQTLKMRCDHCTKEGSM